jgi:hypothetical protein
MNVHEEQFARSFIVPEKRERYLYHYHDMDYRFARLIPAGDQYAEAIEHVLKSKGAPDTCHLFSAESEFDSREMGLSEAWYNVVGSNSGTFVSCVPGKLGYFEFEDMSERYILEKVV